MKQRIVTAIIFVLILIPLIFIGGLPLKITSLILAYLGLREFLRMKKNKQSNFTRVVSYIGITAIVLMDDVMRLIPNYPYYYIVILLVLLALIGATISRKIGYDDAAMSLIGVLYIGFGFYSLYTIRAGSLELILFILICIWVSDSGAFFVGKRYGKNKLAPLLSPNKTIEGALGGVISAGIIGLLFYLLPNISYGVLFSVFLGMMVSVAGQFGDLIESGIKRQFDLKDSGTFFPGHGGILDRFDSLIFALSIAMLLLNF